MEHVASLCPYLLSHCEAAEPPYVAGEAEEAASLSRALRRDATRARLGAEVAALRFDCLAGHLNCPFDDDNDAIARVVSECDATDATDLTRLDLLAFANASLFRSVLLRTLLLRTGAEGEQGEEGGVDEEGEVSGESRRRARCVALLAHEHFLEQFDALVYDYAIVRSLHDGYAFVSISTSLLMLISRTVVIRFSQTFIAFAVSPLRNNPTNEREAGHRPGRRHSGNARRNTAKNKSSSGGGGGGLRLLLGARAAILRGQGDGGTERHSSRGIRLDVDSIEAGGGAHRKRILPQFAGKWIIVGAG